MMLSYCAHLDETVITISMILDSFQDNGVSYYRLYMGCPVCWRNGNPTEPSFWKHYDNNCLGDIYVGDNASYKCEKCGHSVHVLDWKYDCPTHSSSVDFFCGESCSSVDSIGVVRLMPSMVETCGILWIQSFMINFQRCIQKRRGDKE